MKSSYARGLPTNACEGSDTLFRPISSPFLQYEGHEAMKHLGQDRTKIMGSLATIRYGHLILSDRKEERGTFSTAGRPDFPSFWPQLHQASHHACKVKSMHSHNKTYLQKFVVVH